MSKRLQNLNNIVSILKAGSDFYRQAARQTQNADLERVFLEHAELREETARDLARLIDDAGAEPADAAPSEQVRAVATRVGAVFNDTNETLVSMLEEHEDRTLSAFREALHHRDNSGDEEMLRKYMAKFEDSHDRMRTLKHSENPAREASDI